MACRTPLSFRESGTERKIFQYRHLKERGGGKFLPLRGIEADIAVGHRAVDGGNRAHNARRIVQPGPGPAARRGRLHAPLARRRDRRHALVRHGAAAHRDHHREDSPPGQGGHRPGGPRPLLPRPSRARSRSRAGTRSSIPASLIWKLSLYRI